MSQNIIRENAETVYRFSAVVCLSASAILGSFAFKYNNEAVEAGATANALEVQGHPQAIAWQDLAEDKQDNRNLLLYFTGGYLGGAAVMGAAAHGLNSTKRQKL